MKIVKNILDLFLSMRTSIWLLLALLGLLFYGAVIMPLRTEFQGMHTMTLFNWMAENPFTVTWWLWGSIILLSLLAANTVVCSIESLVKKREARNWLLVISPQVIHVGVLFIMFAHLFSSYGTFKGMTYVHRDSKVYLPNGLGVVFNEIHAAVAPSGYVTDWAADISYVEGGKVIAHDVIAPNDPSFQRGMGLYIKQVRMSPFPVALIEVSREPGAVWALIGGILFMAGMMTLLILKIKREDKHRET
jgi:cytochrome c biogenesis protein ResB